MDPDYMPLIHRDPQNISAVLLNDGWHPVEEGDVVTFKFVGWSDYDDKEADPYETGLAVEFYSDKFGEAVLVPIAHVMAYRLDQRMRRREIDDANA